MSTLQSAESTQWHITRSSHPLVDIWIASEGVAGADYHYGGTRLISPKSDDTTAESILVHLAFFESGVKNRLINLALSQGALRNLDSRLPMGFLNSRVAGGRCVLRPRTEELGDLLANPNHPQFAESIDSVLKHVGSLLNQEQGKVKLTPDFGRYAHLADILHQYTEHSLGIGCEKGGCGGKSSYTTTGIIELIERICGHIDIVNTPITLIGSAGALGEDVLKYFVSKGVKDLAICDTVYISERNTLNGIRILRSEFGKFTPECLSRGGIIVATTVGNELENSDWHVLPSKTHFFLAHNSALPTGERGTRIARDLANNGIELIPGPLLTLGGALTSRLELFSRRAGRGHDFDKALAHEVVRQISEHCWSRMQTVRREAESRGFPLTHYEAMNAWLDQKENAEKDAVQCGLH